jgi:drug/metabolite transporter (DMT)-like permease
LAIVFLGVVNTAAVYGIYFWLIEFAGATFASLNNYLVPVIGLILGYLLLGETFTLSTIVGLVMVLGGVFLFGHTTRVRRTVAASAG